MKSPKMSLSTVPILIFLLLALFLQVVFLFSAPNELYPKWTSLHGDSIGPRLFFGFYVFLAPGGALLIFSLYILLVASRKTIFVTGLSLIVFLPFHLIISYWTIYSIVIWGAFIMIEVAFLFYMGVLVGGK